MRAEPRGLGAEGSFMRVVELLTHELGHHHHGRSLRPILHFRDAKMRSIVAALCLNSGFGQNIESQNIEVAEYRVAKYRMRKIPKMQNIESHNINHAKYRRANY